MSFISEMKDLAKSNIKRIILPEGNEERTLKASSIIQKERFADVVLLGDKEEIEKKAKDIGVDISGIEIIDPKTSEKKDDYAKKLFELRKHKGVTLASAEKIVLDPMYFGTMMIKEGDGDGMVSGAVHTTGDLLRPGLQIIKTSPGVNLVSSFFVMLFQNNDVAKDGKMLFADCAVNINPGPNELAEIATTTADSAKDILKLDPKVAMLSFSSKGSAKHEFVDKVQKATSLAQERRKDLEIDGELQLDAAMIPSVAEGKAKGSNVAGKANVLIFPDLQSGNIGYKLVQRFANAKAIGPITQGFAKPINDLSRGCSVEDIVNVVSITAVQAQSK